MGHESKTKVWRRERKKRAWASQPKKKIESLQNFVDIETEALTNAFGYDARIPVSEPCTHHIQHIRFRFNQAKVLARVVGLVGNGKNKAEKRQKNR